MWKNRQNHSQQPQNKRKTFSDSEEDEEDDEEIEGNTRKCRKNANQFIIHQRFLVLKLSVWPELALRGPFFHFPFSSNILKNRELTAKIRQILAEIHKNALEFRNRELQSIIDRAPNSNFDALVRILREMCSKVFRIEKNQLSVEFRIDPIFPAFRKMFAEKKAICEEFSEFRRQISIIFPKIDDSIREDVEFRFLRFFRFYCENFIKFIAKVEPSGVCSYRAYRSMHSNTLFYTRDYPSKTFDFFSRRRRVDSVSVWFAVPFASAPPLELLFDYGILELLPTEFCRFFADWIRNIGEKMRNCLRNGEFQNFARQFEYGELLGLRDTKIERFVRKIAAETLNSSDFIVFNREIEEIAVNLISTARKYFYRPMIKENLRMVNRELWEKLDGLLGNTDGHLRTHCFNQILRFVLNFVWDTPRFVFYYDAGTRKYKFQNEFEEDVNDAWIFENRNSLLPQEPPQFYENRQFSNQFATNSTFSQQVPVFFNPRVPPPNLNFAPNFPPVFHPIPSSFSISEPIPWNSAENTDKEQQMAVEPKKEPETMSEVTEEELANARALRTPSEVSGSILNRIDDDDDEEEVPKKWKSAFRLVLESNEELKAKAESIRKRYEAL